MGLVKRLARKAKEAGSFIYYKICMKTGLHFILCRRVVEFKINVFKQWPPEIVIDENFNQNTAYQNGINFNQNSLKSFWTGDPNSFGWIRYISGTYDRRLRKFLKNQIKNWISENGRLNEKSWRPVVTARRLYNWLDCYNTIVRTSEKSFYMTCTKNMLIQFKFLKRVRFLKHKISQVGVLYKTLIYCSIAINDNHKTTMLTNELTDYLERNFDSIHHIPPIKMVHLLRDLEEVRFALKLKNLTYANILDRSISILKSSILFLINDNGLAVFDSKYTPSSKFLNKMLFDEDAKNLTGKGNCIDFDKIQAFASTIIVNKNEVFFPFEFAFSNQSCNITNRINFRIFNPENNLIDEKVCNYSLEQNGGYSLIYGNSALNYFLGHLAFSRRIFMNNLGTEIRGECIISSSFKLSIINEFVIYEDIALEPSVYQNGVTIILKNGKKLLLNLSKNIDLSFAQLPQKVVNGVVVNPIALRLEAYKNANSDCVCKWLFREV